MFLTSGLREALKKEIDDISSFLYEKQIEIYGEQPEPDYDYYDWIATPEEEVDNEVKNRLSSLKGNMRDKIKAHISEE